MLTFIRNLPKLLWPFIAMLILIFTSLANDSATFSRRIISPHSEEIILNIRSGDEKPTEIVIIRTSSGQKKEINIITHRRLERFFPDWRSRIIYQEDREKVYKQAMRKRREALRTKMPEDFNRSKNEQDAIDYFLGRGFYKTHQDPNMIPNIFDNRQSFLIKMHDKKTRMNFLKNFNKGHT
jgi:hypothetical protein